MEEEIGILSSSRGRVRIVFPETAAVSEAVKECDLRVPWRRLDRPSAPSLLCPKARIGDFVGREKELEWLSAWAEAPEPVSLKFLGGGSGAGKSRLAAEFAERLRRKGWSAGFVDPRRPLAFSPAEEGVLLILDRPEEFPAATRALLHSIARAKPAGKWRILLLTRKYEKGRNALLEGVERVVPQAPSLVLSPLSAEALYRIFSSARRRTGKYVATDPPAAGKASFFTWLQRNPDHATPLFVTAAAVFSALHPERSPFVHGAAEALRRLALLEAARLRRVAEEHGLPSAVFLRLLALAAIAGEVPRERLSQVLISGLCGPASFFVADPTGTVEAAGLLKDGQIEAPKPDGLAAVLLTEALDAHPASASLFIWKALEPDPVRRLERFAWLAEDAAAVLPPKAPPLHHRLMAILDGHPDRCRALEPAFERTKLPLFFSEVGIRLIQTLLKAAPSLEQKAALFIRLSEIEEQRGDLVAAEADLRRAIGIHRRLAMEDPETFRPRLAETVFRFGLILEESGRDQEALAAMQEAIDLYLLAAKSTPLRFLPETANAFNHLFVLLDRFGQKREAFEALRESEKRYRHLAETNPDRFEVSLAGILGNLAEHLADSGHDREALEAVTEAVNLLLRRNKTEVEILILLHLRLQRFDLLRKVGDREKAKKEISETAEAARRAGRENPDFFGRKLIDILFRLGTFLDELGEMEAVEAIFRELVNFVRPFAERDPAGYGLTLAAYLYDLAMASRLNDRPAVETAREAVALYRRFGGEDPRNAKSTAEALIELSVHLQRTGKPAEAVGCLREAVGIYRRLAKTEDRRYEENLAGTLWRWFVLEENLQTELELIREVVDIYRRLAENSPGNFVSQLADALRDLSFSLVRNQRPHDVVDPLRERVDLLRRAAEKHPERFEAERIYALLDLAQHLNWNGDPVAAAGLENETLSSVRRLAKKEARYEELLAETLVVFARILQKRGYVKALSLVHEALRRYRRLAKKDPAYREKVAETLNEAGVCLDHLGRPDKARRRFAQALRIQRELAAEAPERHDDLLGLILDNLSLMREKTLPFPPFYFLRVFHERVEVHRRRAERNLSAAGPDLVDSLRSLARCYAPWRRPEKVSRLLQETISVLRRLEESSPGRYEEALAETLLEWAVRLKWAGQKEEARRALLEAEKRFLRLGEKEGYEQWAGKMLKRCRRLLRKC